MTTRHILLVADSAGETAVVASLLRCACPACRLHVVTDAERAIAYLAGEGAFADREASPLPALVLLDLTLPGTPGLAVLEWRHTRPDILAIPLVVLTAPKASADLQRAYELGADSYVLKPVTKEALADTVTTLAPALDGPVRVLVVDDSADDRRLAADLLARGIPGVEIEPIASPDELERAAATDGFDAVVTDFHTGSFSGIDHLRAVKARWPGCPVIILTGSASSEDLARLLRAGADDYVLKDPRDLTRLAAAVRSAIGEARAKRALIDSEERFRDLVEHSRDLICTHDLEGRLLSVNPAVSRMSGYSQNELLGMNLRDTLAPEAWDGFVPYLTTIKERGAAKGLLVVLTKGGERRVWEYDNTLRTEGVAAPMVRGLAHDVTERVEVERALRQSERRYRHIFEHAIEGIYQTTPQGRYLSVNPAFARMYGYASPQEMIAAISDIGRQVYVLPEERDRFKAKLAEHGSVVGFEAWGYRKDGTTICTSINAQVVRDGQGKVLYYEGTTENITERRRAEEALRASEERYRTILQSIVEGYFEVDIRGTMTFCNDSMTTLLGYPREELIGLNNRVYMDEANAARVYETFNRVFRTGVPAKALNWELNRKDGSRITVETSVALLRDAEDRPIGFRGLVRDVTERTRLEEHLRHAQKMEAVGTLAGGMAHDFNNLLQAMLSLLQLVRDERSDPERATACLAELEDHVRRGAQLTRQLLVFSRRETTKREVLDLNDVVRDAASLLRRLLRENIAFSLQLADESLPLEADRGQLVQVVTNLALNAADAMPEGGTLIVRTGRDGVGLWLEVEDTGDGIPEEIRERIFEPFFTTKSAGKGTGLGLSVVHAIVTSFEGRIDLESRVGRGTRFRVVLPQAASALPGLLSEREAQSRQLVEGHGERILVVEDEQGAREGLRDILGAFGYEVVAVGSGEEAQALAVLPAFDVVLSDLMLPGIPGPQLMRILRQRWPAVRVILMSGYAEDEAVRRGVETGEVRFLQKPFGMETLAREISAVLADAPSGQPA